MVITGFFFANDPADWYLTSSETFAVFYAVSVILLNSWLYVFYLGAALVEFLAGLFCNINENKPVIVIALALEFNLEFKTTVLVPPMVHMYFQLDYGACCNTNISDSVPSTIHFFLSIFLSNRSSVCNQGQCLPFLRGLWLQL